MILIPSVGPLPACSIDGPNACRRDSRVIDDPDTPQARMTGYETDLVPWSEEQAKALRAAARPQPNAPIDFETIAEEIESLGLADRRALSTRVLTLLEHM